MPIKPDAVPWPIQGRYNFKMNMFYYDSKNQSQYMRIVEFLQDVVAAYPNWVWERPNDKSPWHWRTEVDYPDGSLTLNVYPHKGAWNLQDTFTSEVPAKGAGWDALLHHLKELKIT